MYRRKEEAGQRIRFLCFRCPVHADSVHSLIYMALGLNNPYTDKDYRILAIAFLLIDFFVEIVSDAFKNVLKRGYLDELIATCKHVALVEIITTFFLFTTPMGEIYSRCVLLHHDSIYILVSLRQSGVKENNIKKKLCFIEKITICHSDGKAS